MPKGANEQEWLTTTMRGDPGFRIIPVRAPGLPAGHCALCVPGGGIVAALAPTLRTAPCHRLQGGEHNQEWLMSQTRMPERLPRAGVEALAQFTVDIGKLMVS